MAGASNSEDRGRDQESPKKAPSYSQRIESHIGRRMLAGFVVLVPLAITYFVLRLIVINLDDVVRPLARGKLSIFDFPGVGLVFVAVVLYIVGVVVTRRVGRKAVGWQHAVLSRIPVVKSIYGVVSQVTDALAAPLEKQFSRVAFVEWPRPGLYALGFVTGYYRSRNRETPDSVVVYIPTIPNPTSGNLAFMAPDEIIDAGMSVEEAMKLVFSGGIVLPPPGDRPELRDPVEVDG